MRHDRLSLVVSRPCHDALHEAAELRRHMSVLEEEPATWHKARSQTIYCCIDSSESGTQAHQTSSSLSVRTDVLLSRSGIICRQRSQVRSGTRADIPTTKGRRLSRQAKNKSQLRGTLMDGSID